MKCLMCVNDSNDGKFDFDRGLCSPCIKKMICYEKYNSELTAQFDKEFDRQCKPYKRKERASRVTSPKSAPSQLKDLTEQEAALIGLMRQLEYSENMGQVPHFTQVVIFSDGSGHVDNDKEDEIFSFNTPIEALEKLSNYVNERTVGKG